MAAPRTRARANGASVIETPGVLDAEIFEIDDAEAERDVESLPVFTDVAPAMPGPLDGIYRFKLKKGPFTGKRTFFRLDNDEAVMDNGGKRRLMIENYAYETKSKAIYDDLMRQIVGGKLRDITQEIIVMVPCPFGCGVQFRSNEPDKLNAHVQEVHIQPQIAQLLADEAGG